MIKGMDKLNLSKTDNRSNMMQKNISQTSRDQLMTNPISPFYPNNNAYNRNSIPSNF